MRVGPCEGYIASFRSARPQPFMAPAKSYSKLLSDEDQTSIASSGSAGSLLSELSHHTDIVAADSTYLEHRR